MVSKKRDSSARPIAPVLGQNFNESSETVRILIKAVEQSPVSVIITDIKGVIQYVNPKFTKLMGYTSAEAIGKTPRIIKGDFLSREFYKQMWDTILSGEEWHGVFHNRTKSGEFVWEMASISPIRDEMGIITHFVGVKEDITELKRLQEQLEHSSHHDQLTGLPNRLLFNDRLEQALVQANRRNSSFAVLFLDLDEFKSVNDTYGHSHGDGVLIETANRLSGCLRKSDTLARMGGDEFTAIVLDIQGKGDAARIAQSMIDALSEPFITGTIECKIGVSIGISYYPKDGVTADSLRSTADTAMYEAKRGGRMAFRFAGEV